MKFQPIFYHAPLQKKSPIRPKPTVSQNLPISKLCATAQHSKTLRPIQMDRRANCRPRCGGADSRTRTDDLLITNELLYQLSHISIFDLILYDTPHIALQQTTCSYTVRNIVALLGCRCRNSPYFFPSQAPFICLWQRSLAQQMSCSTN